MNLAGTGAQSIEGWHGAGTPPGESLWPAPRKAGLPDAETTRLNELVETNLRFVGTIAGEYRHCGVPFEDLVAEGRLGMVMAARRFDPDHGVKFVTYAVWWIRKTILAALDRQGHLVRIPDSRLREYRRQRRDADLQNRRPVTTGRGARLRVVPLNVACDDLNRTLSGRAVSLDARSDEDRESLGDRIPTEAPGPEELLGRSEASRLCASLLRGLSEEEKTLLAHRFGLQGRPRLTFKDLGRRMGISHEQVRQNERRLLERLRLTLESGRMV